MFCMKAKGGLVLWSSCDKHYTHAPLLTHIITYLGQVHVLFFPWKHRGLKIRKKVPFSEDVLLFASKAKINVFWRKKLNGGGGRPHTHIIYCTIFPLLAPYVEEKYNTRDWGEIFWSLWSYVDMSEKDFGKFDCIKSAKKTLCKPVNC